MGQGDHPSDVKVTNGDLNAQHLQALQDRIRTKPALVAGTDVEKAG